MSAPGCSVGFVFESVFDVDAGASEAELRAVVERCEQLKSAAAAAQARENLSICSTKPVARADVDSIASKRDSTCLRTLNTRFASGKYARKLPAAFSSSADA